MKRPTPLNGLSSAMSVLRFRSWAGRGGLLLVAARPRILPCTLFLLAFHLAPGSAEAVLSGTIVLQGFVSGGQSATEQRSGISAIAAVATQPADAPAQSGVAADHGHIMEASQRIAMKVQVPCAPGAASHQHEF